MNLPNKLTLGRIICTAIMIVFLLLQGPVFSWLSFVLFCVAALTDFFDGHIARARGLVTNLGKFMDPLADKILNYAVMVLLIPEGLIPPLALTLILFREFLVTGIRQLGAEQGMVIAANWWGKVKTGVQDASLVIILLFRALDLSFLDILSPILIWICAALTLLSGGIYLWQNRAVLKDHEG